MTRRSWFAALVAPLVARALPKEKLQMGVDPALPGYSFGWSGFKHADGFRNRPVVLPPDARSVYSDGWSLSVIQETINDCTHGRSEPKYIVVTQALRDRLWLELPEGHRFHAWDAELQMRGFSHFYFMGCTVVVDPELHAGEMVIVTPDRINDHHANAVIRFSNLPECIWGGNIIVSNPRFAFKLGTPDGRF